MLNYRYKAYEPGIKKQWVEMAINGSGIRDTARVLCSYVGDKSNQRWIWLAVDHSTNTVLAYVFGRRKDVVNSLSTKRTQKSAPVVRMPSLKS